MQSIEDLTLYFDTHIDVHYLHLSLKFHIDRNINTEKIQDIVLYNCVLSKNSNGVSYCR